MATLTTTNNDIESSLTLTAGAGDDTGASTDVRASFGGVAFLKLTNGATGPTVAAQIELQGSGDDTVWYSIGGPLVGTTGNSEVTSWRIEYGIGDMYIRAVAGSNTGQNVSMDFDLTTTAIA